MLGKLFGAKKAAPAVSAPPSSVPGSASTTINAIQNLTEREEQLEKRKGLLEKRINDELEKAKEFTRAKKKSQALMCLKKKKQFEQQVEQVDQLILRVNEQKAMLEGTRTLADVVSTMKHAADASKATMKEMKIENVDKVLEEIQEQNEQMRMVQEAIAQPTGMGAELDEDELLGELEELEAEELDKQLLQPAPVPAQRAPATALPSAPKTQATKTKEEEELEQLMEEMKIPA